MDNDLIAYCGVDCVACSDYASQRCPGCRQTDWTSEDVCPPVACCEGKGIWCCGECPVFPCEQMQEFYEESETHREAHQRMLKVVRPGLAERS